MFGHGAKPIFYNKKTNSRRKKHSQITPIRCDIETLSIDRELNKANFYGKIIEKMCFKN